MSTKKNGESKYMQIYHQLRLNLYAKEYNADGSFPSENEIMSKFNVSRTTVRKALDMLKKEGLIKSCPGHGTDVLASFDPSINRQAETAPLTSITGVYFDFIPNVASIKHSEILVDTIPSDNEIAESLRIPVGTIVYRIRWLHLVNDKPYLYLTNFLKLDMFPDLPSKAKDMISLYPLLEKNYGTKFTHGEEVIVPTTADFISARILDVNVDSPLMMLKRKAYCNEGPMEYSISIIRPDLMRIRMVMA